jgi:hypothetical protein
MKRTTLTGLFITASLLAAPVFAADDLCAVNLQKIKDEQTISTPAKPAVSDTNTATLEKAQAAHAKGDEKTCITETTKILSDIEKSKKGGAAGS